MKTFLKVDLGIQVLFYLTSLLGLAMFFGGGDPEVLFYGFLGLGAWQLFSAVTIMFTSKSTVGRGRYFLYAISYLFASVILFFIYPIYFLGAFAFSIWYFRISYEHLRRLENARTSFWDLA